MHYYRRLIIIISLFLLCMFYVMCVGVLFTNESSNDTKEEVIEMRENDEAYTRKIHTVESENSKRLDRVELVCRKYGIGLYKDPKNPSPIKHPPTPQYQVFFFDKEHKWAICPIYKAGSTTWLTHLLTLAGMTDQEIKNSKKQLSELVRARYPEAEYSTAEEMLHTSMKIMTVRHPFERVLSAYRDKLENINQGWEHGTRHFFEAYGQKIVNKFRKGGSSVLSSDILEPGDYIRNPNAPAPAGVEPTFKEFVQYLIGSNLVSKSDDHWIPYYIYCTPCLLKYEFIAKTETLHQDQQYIIHALGLSDKIKPRWQHKTQFNNSDKDNVNAVSSVSTKYFHQLTSEEIVQLYEKYKMDFELFGYSHQPYLKYARKKFN